LARLIGSGLTLRETTYVKKLNSPTSYYIHCNLVDKTKNFSNGKRSDILAKFEMKGLPYEKINYISPPQNVLRECSTEKSINSITISVRDSEGELFDFKGSPLEFELEIN